VSASGPRWLDALARRSVRRDAPSAHGDEVVGGMSRRALVRLAGGAVIAGAAMRMPVPTAAVAQTASACITARRKTNTNHLNECMQGKQQAYKAWYDTYQTATAKLDGNTDAASRARLEVIVNKALDGMGRVADSMGKCASQYMKDERDSFIGCTLEGPTQPRGPDDNPQQAAEVGDGGGCPRDTTYPCGDGRCCFTGTFCCGCGCCIYHDCRCCVGA
jgi:hypothetical protein